MDVLYPSALNKLSQGIGIGLLGQTGAFLNPFAADKKVFLGTAQYHHDPDLCGSIAQYVENNIRKPLGNHVNLFR